MRCLGFVVALVAGLVVSSAAGAQTLQAEIAGGVLADGWWDETGSLSRTDMDELVDRWGDHFAFVYTDREFAVQGEPEVDPVPLLAQSILEELDAAGSQVTTVLMIAGSSGGGASVEFSYPQIVQAFSRLDASTVVASFDSTAERISNRNFDDPLQASDPLLSGERIAILVGLVVVMMMVGFSYLLRRKRALGADGARPPAVERTPVPETSQP